jgi:hypothetical protein
MLIGMDQDRLAKLCFESAPGRIPDSYEVVDGKQYATMKCGCEAVVIQGNNAPIDEPPEPVEYLGWVGCSIHQYDDDGELIGRVDI